MESSNGPAEQGDAASAQPDAEARRGRAADARSQLTGGRERFAERERLADERDRKAGDREAVADEREQLADEREREDDRRETALVERLREVEERERELDERRRALGEPAKTLEQQALEAIERSRSLMSLSGERLDRWEAAIMRSQAGRERQQAEIDRAVAESERAQAAMPPDPGKAVEQASALGKQALTAIEAFPAKQDEIVRIHEDLAAECLERRDECMRAADPARTTAAQTGRRRARIHGLTYSCPPPGSRCRASGRACWMRPRVLAAAVRQLGRWLLPGRLLRTGAKATFKVSSSALPALARCFQHGQPRGGAQR
jgi:hypothetical protein